MRSERVAGLAGDSVVFPLVGWGIVFLSVRCFFCP